MSHFAQSATSKQCLAMCHNDFAKKLLFVSSKQSQHFFQVRFQSLLSALSGLGCFSAQVSDLATENGSEITPTPKTPSCLSLALPDVSFHHSGDEKRSYSKILGIFHHLYLLATDTFKDELINKIAKLEHSLSSSSQ